ncbi:molybdopterin synthase sulfur carrier subunit [Formosimonas limnophila]|uniref:Molybdopterin synthase sulfur carrier subunit n=1 Tax=Formosimonas limnophila TaxID=1384487 RepID=A0A8J3CNP7_9BURK|nr:molybdopterin converting factor subunit 1 [Formosimonas limnophila]GHA76349.1 molybdopterin synthase sulfur carrier subunit [Formosimonas limnophila]
MIQVLYFARFKEVFGVAQERLPSFDTTDALLKYLIDRGDVWAAELDASRSWRMAVNQQVVHGCAALADGDEVAIFPPVTGG